MSNVTFDNAPLTEEQKQMIEEKRQKALALRAASIARRNLEAQNANNSNGIQVKLGEPLKNPCTFPIRTVIPNNVTMERKSTNNETAASSSKIFSAAECKNRMVCSLISRERFSVTFGFNKDIIGILKSIPGHAYVQLVKPLEPDMRFVAIPQFVLKVFKNSQHAQQQFVDVDLSTVDAHLVDSLFPFQRDAVCFGVLKKGRVLIADDMGLGKTIEAIGIACFYKQDWPLLVITPSSMRYSWKEAFEKWLPSLDPQSVTVINTAKEPVGNVAVLIVTYDLLTKKTEFMKERNFQAIIVDESHLMKNFKTARTKAILPLLKVARRVILLSGTPALSRPSELYTQISAIDPNLFPSFQIFAYRYCNAKMMPWGLDSSGASNMIELQHVLEEHVMIRRLKSDVITQLPPKRREMVILDPTKITTNTKSMKYAAKHINETSLRGMEKHGALLQYFHETGAAKLDAVCGYVIDLLEAGKKFLCFAHHQNVLDGICEAIRRKTPKLQFIRIDGSTNGEMRKTLCDRFQTSDCCRVAVLSITAANMGITLTAAQLVVFAELFWNPGILTQAEDRAHRIGQRDFVLVQYLVARGTSDDYLWPLVQGKLDVLNKAGLSKDNFCEADTKIQQCREQPTIDDFFQKEDDWLDDVDWDEISQYDSPEQPIKKIKSNQTST